MYAILMYTIPYDDVCNASCFSELDFLGIIFILCKI